MPLDDLVGFEVHSPQGGRAPPDVDNVTWRGLETHKLQSLELVRGGGELGRSDREAPEHTASADHCCSFQGPCVYDREKGSWLFIWG